MLPFVLGHVAKSIPLILHYVRKNSSSPYPDTSHETINAMRPVRTYVWTDETCKKRLRRNMPFLLQRFKKEQYGPYKSDMCRLAVLYEYGGIYVDNDILITRAFPELFPILRRRELVTVKEALDSGIMQGFIATIPRHPVVMQCAQIMRYVRRGTIAFERAIRWYEGDFLMLTEKFSHDIGFGTRDTRNANCNILVAVNKSILFYSHDIGTPRCKGNPTA